MSIQDANIKTCLLAWNPFQEVKTEAQGVTVARVTAVVSFLVCLKFAYEAASPLLRGNDSNLLVILGNIVVASFFLCITVHIIRRQALWAAIVVAVFFFLSIINAVLAMRAGYGRLPWLWIATRFLFASLLIVGIRGTLKLQEIRRAL